MFNVEEFRLNRNYFFVENLSNGSTLTGATLPVRHARHVPRAINFLGGFLLARATVVKRASHSRIHMG